MKAIKNIYDNELYTIIIVILALVSLFGNISDSIDLLIDGIFIIDLIIATSVFVKFSKSRTLKNYFKLHSADIISCIPIQFLSIFKTFRLIRLVRISRLVKIKRTISISHKITLSTLFKVDTIKELGIYLVIYIIGNVYIFQTTEHVTTLKATYWVVETLSTVGYGDISPTQPITMILAIILMIVGVAVMGYVNGAVISAVINQVNKK